MTGRNGFPFLCTPKEFPSPLAGTAAHRWCPWWDRSVFLSIYIFIIIYLSVMNVPIYLLSIIYHLFIYPSVSIIYLYIHPYLSSICISIYHNLSVMNLLTYLLSIYPSSIFVSIYLPTCLPFYHPSIYLDSIIFHVLVTMYHQAFL